MKTYLIFFSFFVTVFIGFSQKSTPIVDKRKKENITYQTVKIGKKEWMSENLRTSRFLNGDLILEAKSDEEWLKAATDGTPAWCYYNNDPKLGETYGKLYNWFAISDPRGLAPAGWEIPNDCDYWDLVNELGGKEGAGYRMKSIMGWKNENNTNQSNGLNGNGNNNSGFNSKPGGYREFKNYGSVELKFYGLGNLAMYWTSSIDNKTGGVKCTTGNFNLGDPLYYLNREEDRTCDLQMNADKSCGFSVRCVKKMIYR
jgi:uncharacterized protein (TIGR02145 family)